VSSPTSAPELRRTGKLIADCRHYRTALDGRAFHQNEFEVCFQNDSRCNSAATRVGNSRDQMG
jgi:hypothetical protein